MCVFYVLCTRACVWERKCWDGWLCAKQLGKKWCRRRKPQVRSVCWCMAPPSCPPPIGDVNPQRDICSLPPSWMSTISMVGNECGRHNSSSAKKKKRKKSRTDTPGALPFFFFICALWPDHTHLILDVVVAWLVPPTFSPPTHLLSTTRLMDRRQLERIRNGPNSPEKKKDRKQNHGWFFFLFLVCHVCSCVNLHGRCRSVSPLSVFPQSFNLIFFTISERKRKS